MYKLLLKKSFFDGWDNILFLCLSNIVFAACVAAVAVTGKTVVLLVSVLVFSFHLLGVNGAAFNFVRCKGGWAEGYAKAIRKAGHLAVFYVAMILCAYIVLYVAPMYMSFGDLVWYTLGVFMFSCGIILFLVMIYYFPLCLALENDGPFKTLKKCFIVFFDNFKFSVYLWLKNICDLTLSVFTVLLMPGFSGLCISTNTAVYFMMLRYDYMEEKKVGKHNVSADMYLSSLSEQYSERNLHTLFFPWKTNK